ncbi:MAG: tRNA (adenosine(37)-N6)-threonylcarbamoyltransferase complex dimerization subunit type 1 TsaB [bacterium]|nr:tRNA (adenosine(37)-N6)-threonylcarbamoyltransferase complex dimerization subunit type 1 TsaB [bacterium]
MILLAVDSATAFLSLALDGGDGTGAEFCLKGPGAHAEAVVGAMRSLLGDARVRPSQLGAVVAGIGPGSFTGIRVAVAAAKGLAYALGIPAVGVPTLDAMAAGLPCPEGLVCPILDARRGEVYGAVYQNSPPAPLTGYLNLPLEDFLERLEAGRPVLFLGDGALRYRQIIQRRLAGRAQVAPEAFAYPRGLVLARMGRERLAAGDGGDPLQLAPLYLRRSEAETRCPQ